MGSAGAAGFFSASLLAVGLEQEAAKTAARRMPIDCRFTL